MMAASLRPVWIQLMENQGNCNWMPQFRVTHPIGLVTCMGMLLTNLLLEITHDTYKTNTLIAIHSQVMLRELWVYHFLKRMNGD
jgi:hypothetical protein